ncbi:MAG: YbaK/EbsC family protein [Candidatus Aenigmarchaeota archaeon]|nr:YbaK/EbsC family protein [Candidatus Aenigmarchaeota archaeon]
MLSEKDLEKFLKERGVDFELIEFKETVMNSESAAKKTNGIVVKSILLICDDEPILCILLGKDKIDFEKIKKELNCREVRLAKAKEVKEISGYDIGAVPPFVHKQKIRTIIDSKVDGLREDEEIYCGGGSHYHLLKIRKSDLMRVIENAEIKDITQ